MISTQNDRKATQAEKDRTRAGVEAALSGLLDTLWAQVMQPVTTKLEAFGIAPARSARDNAPEILLMSVGDFALPPLHASWRDIDGRMRCVLDDYAIAHTPSLDAARISRQRARRLAGSADPPRLLAVVDPDHQVISEDAEGRRTERRSSRRRCGRCSITRQPCSCCAFIAI